MPNDFDPDEEIMSFAALPGGAMLAGLSGRHTGG